MSPTWKKRPSHEEHAEQAQIRAQLYRVQAAAFLDPPDEELLSFLQDNYPFLFPAPARLTPEFIKTLRVDFTNIFVMSAPPYEAALLDESGHLNSKATDRVTDFYRACGYNPGRGSAGASHPSVLAMDHLSVELEFLAHLAQTESDAWGSGDAARAGEHLTLASTFMDDHLLRWVPIYTTGVERDAESDFYRGLSRWTREFILEDRVHISNVLKAIGR